VRRVEPAPRSYASTAVLKLTSGSSGSPKAALTSEAQLIADGTQIAGAMGIQPPDTQIAAIPLSHAYGLGVLLMPMLLQGTAIVLRESFVPHQLPLDARRFGARIFPGVPFMFQYFIANPPVDGWPSSLERLISAGAPLPSATVWEFREQFGTKIHSFYGTTETGGIAFDAGDEIEEGAHVGPPLPGVTITLTDDEDVPAGTGRIHVSSAAVADGYFGHIGEGFEREGFLTGDYGTIDARGRLTLRGRLSSFVNVAGRKVQPEEVEQVLRAMPGVEDVRVLGAPDPRRGQQIVACVVADGASGVDVLGLRRFCAARLAAHKIPRTVVFLNAIPLTTRGKTDRAALDAIVRAQLGI
jgi:acyl-CoA synthetase (AMP-forming)/AMP-acid ligase II